MRECTHRLCEIIHDRAISQASLANDVVLPCSLAIVRSRGCRPNAFADSTAPEVFEEVRALLVRIDVEPRTEDSVRAAVRLAQIFRREALDERNLLAQARAEEPELAEPLARLCARR